MSAAMTFSKISGQSSTSQPCSRMSGQTPVAMSWSIARTTSTSMPCSSMMCRLMSTRPWVLLGSGDFFKVQLMNSALRPLKSRSMAGVSVVVTMSPAADRWLLARTPAVSEGQCLVRSLALHATRDRRVVDVHNLFVHGRLQADADAKGPHPSRYDEGIDSGDVPGPTPGVTCRCRATTPSSTKRDVQPAFGQQRAGRLSRRRTGPPGLWPGPAAAAEHRPVDVAVPERRRCAADVEDRMTIDSVVMRTAITLGLVILTAALTWVFLPDGRARRADSSASPAWRAWLAPASVSGSASSARCRRRW